MKKKTFFHFFIKLVLICIPIIIIVTPVAYVLYISGEFVNLDRLVNNPINESNMFLLGLAYSNPEIYYKSHVIKNNKPKIISLGTSRVLYFRDFFFINKDSFYNAGRTIRNLNQYAFFVENSFVKKIPEIIIIGLDQCFFNDNWKHNKTIYAYKKLLNTKPSIHNILRKEFFRVISDLMEGKINIKRLNDPLNQHRIGISAIINTDGFRNDGSYYNGFRKRYYEEWEDFEFKRTFKSIEERNLGFEHGEDVSIDALVELENILAYSRKRNIHVVGFLPPYAPSVIERIKDEGNRYGYIWKIYEKSAPIFNKYQYSLFDFTDMSTYGSTDNEFIDGIHGSEKTYAKLFIEMAQNDPILYKHANIELLKNLLEYSSDDLLLEEDSFFTVEYTEEL